MKYLYVKMPDGTYKIPAQVIAHNRAKYYSGVYKNTTYQQEYDDCLADDHEIYEWAVGDMNWADVEEHATLVTKSEKAIDREDEWLRCEKYVKEE